MFAGFTPLIVFFTVLFLAGLVFTIVDSIVEKELSFFFWPTIACLIVLVPATIFSIQEQDRLDMLEEKYGIEFDADLDRRTHGAVYYRNDVICRSDHLESDVNTLIDEECEAPSKDEVPNEIERN